GIFSYWMNSFWGGSLAALGGCLFFGAVPRLVEGIGRPNVKETSRSLCFFLGALGLVLLANTRPFEGFLVTLPAMMLVFWSLLNERFSPILLARIVAPGILLLIFSCVVMLVYQKAVTGYALKAPYTVATEQYRLSPPFLFQSPLPVHNYHHLELRL